MPAISDPHGMNPNSTRTLGRNGPLVPRVGFGTMGLSQGYGKPLPDQQRLSLLDRAYEIGATFWDTSDFYGDSEDLLGKWFAGTGNRNDIFLATKFGGVVVNDTEFSFRGDAAYVQEACNKSLKRMGIEFIDLYYPHRLSGATPVEHIVQEMVELKKQGKIRYLGLSEVSAETLRRAYAVHPITAVQVEYSLFTTEIEDSKVGLLAACRELGVAVVGYSPLSRGMLTGQIRSRADFEVDDYRLLNPRFSDENFPKNLEIVKAVQEIATEKGCTAGQLAIAWLLSQGDDIFPIPGTTKPKYLEENFAAMNVGLTPQEVSRIRTLVDNAVVSGARYDEAHAFALFADTPLP